jgi:hypothetical protein
VEVQEVQAVKEKEKAVKVKARAPQVVRVRRHNAAQMDITPAERSLPTPQGKFLHSPFDPSSAPSYPGGRCIMALTAHTAITSMTRFLPPRITPHTTRPIKFCGQYNSHSFRRGAAHSATAAGLPENEIQLLGRWSSNSYKIYMGPNTVRHVILQASTVRDS